MVRWSIYDSEAVEAKRQLVLQGCILYSPTAAECSYKDQALWELVKRSRFEEIVLELQELLAQRTRREQTLEAEITRLQREQRPAIMITLATNLATGEERTYVGLSPEQTAMAAYAQQHGDYNTWDYETKYKHLVRSTGLLKCSCGDWGVCVMTESEMLSKHDAERKDPGSQQV